MFKIEDFFTNEQIQSEYRKSFLLNIFRKICVRMNRDDKYKLKIQNLFRESFDKNETVKIIIKKEFDYEMPNGTSPNSGMRIMLQETGNISAECSESVSTLRPKAILSNT